ncbi:MAG TPA: MFS transporter [Burkholderiales bacterium]|jgi:predicted MFS family arabinose efflux permease|nr:MFS transporter [Burkholderiales bacterium]
MAIYLIVLLCILNHAAFTGSRVVFSLYALDLGASSFAIGVLVSFYALCPLLLAIYAGKLIDRVGARRPMLLGTLGLVGGICLPVAVQGLPVLYFAALLLGSSFMFFFVAVQGVTGAVGGPQDRGRNYSLLSVGFSIASFMGPLIAGFSIDHLGFRNALIVLSGGIVLSLIAQWLRAEWIPRPTHNPDKAGGQSVLDLLRIAPLRRIFIASGFMSGAWDLYNFYMPIYAHSVKLSATAIGVILATFSAATLVIRLFLPRMLKNHDEIRILTVAIFVAGIAYALFPFFENAWALAAISFLLGLGLGTGQPLSMNLIYNLAPPGRTSEAAGIRVTVNNLAHVTIPLVFGGIGSALGFGAVFISNAAVLFAGAVINNRTAARKD